jgi:polyisoprenoid-binding protein YceI
MVFHPVLGPRVAVALACVLVAGAVSPSLARADMQRFAVESAKSRVSFDAFHPWTVGVFSAASDGPTGEFEIDISDLRQPVKGGLTVSAAGFRSGDASRDKDIRRALDVDHHQEIQYRIDKMDSSFPSLAENNDVILTIHGVLSVKGIERPTTFAGRIRLRPGGALWIRGESWLKPRDWGVPLLRSWLVNMKDSVLAIFDLTLNKSQ